MSNLWPKWAHPVLAFLTGKGLLIVPGILPRASEVIALNKALKVGRELEPRVIEVLPAAIIHFPANFADLSKLPKELKKIIEAIKRDATDGPDLEGIPYAAMKRWANETLPDKRVIPARMKRRMVSYRISPEAIAALKRKARKENLTDTEALERCILRSD